MAVEQILDSPVELLRALGTIGLWLQALGVVATLWLIFSIINAIRNRQNNKLLKQIDHRLMHIEKRLKKLE